MSQQQNQPAIGTAQSSNTRLWGKFGSLGLSNGNLIGNFYPTDGSAHQTVVIPMEQKDYVMAALVNQLTTLTGFNKPFAAYVTVESLFIYK